MNKKTNYAKPVLKKYGEVKKLTLLGGSINNDSGPMTQAMPEF